MNLSFLSLGCHNLTAGSSRVRSERLVRSALDLGITRFDVAPSYGLGTAERMLGDALGHRRNDSQIEITTKFGVLPDRYGVLKAWLREPYRWAKQLARRPGNPPAERQHAAMEGGDSAANVDPLGPCQAAERSLRALRVERLGAFLTHEAVGPDRRGAVLEGLATLRGQGLIARAGFSGALPHVQAMLEASGATAEIAQVSILDLPSLPLVGEARGFNMSRLASRLLADKGLRTTLAHHMGSATVGTALGASISWAHATYPNAVFLVNASTPERLSALLTPLAEGRLSAWAVANAPSIAAIAANR